MGRFGKVLCMLFAVSFLMSCACRNGSCMSRKRYYARRHYGVVIVKDSMQYASVETSK